MKCNVSILQYLSINDKKDDYDIFDSQGPMSMDNGFLCLIYIYQSGEKSIVVAERAGKRGSGR
jgi:hypothetical protein